MPIVLMVAVPSYMFGLALGFLLFFKPAFAIEIQRRFFLAINWRLEPVSMERELRMTRYMGIFLLVMVAVSIVLTYYML